MKNGVVWGKIKKYLTSHTETLISLLKISRTFHVKKLTICPLLNEIFIFQNDRIEQIVKFLTSEGIKKEGKCSPSFSSLPLVKNLDKLCSSFPRARGELCFFLLCKSLPLCESQLFDSLAKTFYDFLNDCSTKINTI